MKIKTNCLNLLFSLILGLSLISCDNFLKGSDTQKQLEKQIAYANAPSYLIKVTFQEGTGSIAKPASGETLKKVTDTFDIRFEPLPDFAFICWQVTSKKLAEGQNINDYVEIEDIQKAETSVTFKKALEDIVITARVAERAQIISYSPMTSEVLKDSSVLVQFDHDMNEDSIYYTKDDIDALKQSLGEENITFLPSKKTQGRFYGYKKLATDNITEEYFFKNISFVDNETNENLTNHYDEPYFATPKMLTINTNKDNPIGDYTPILVTIDKNFFYTFDDGSEKGKDVSMTGSKKWTYQVNDQVDKEPPKFLESDYIKISMNAGLTEKSPLSYTKIKPVVSESTLFNRDKKISLNIKVTDTESGPADQFYIVLSKIQDKEYNDIATPDVETRSVNYQRVSSQKGLINKEIDLSSLFADKFSEENSNELSDGVYRLNFEFKDRSGKTLTYPKEDEEHNSYYYYFTVDNTPITKPVITIKSNNSSTYTVEWNAPAETDYQKAIVSMGASYNKDILKGTNIDTFSEITSGNKYTISVVFRDYAGNETEPYVIPKFLTGFEISGIPDFSAENASKIDNLFFEDDFISDYGLILKSYWSDGTCEDITSGKKVAAISSHKSKVKISYSYTCGDVTKQTDTSGSYYIAYSKAKFTQTPVRLDNYTGSVSDGTYYAFGDYPQTIAPGSQQDDSYYSTATVYKDWKLGDDGYFYERCKENANTASTAYKKYSDNTVASSSSQNKYKYFKIEPIVWRVLTTAYNGSSNSLLLAEKALVSNIPFYGTQEERKVNGKKFLNNNYMYSNIRAYLNGTDNQFFIDTNTRKSGDIDWTDNGFLQKAFTQKAQDLIAITEVDNSQASTFPRSNDYDYDYYYGINILPRRFHGSTDYWEKNYNTCPNTMDKIFLLSIAEATKSGYGFGHYEWSDNNRIHKATDYALANNCFLHSSYPSNGSAWMLRSPGFEEMVLNASQGTYTEVSFFIGCTLSGSFSNFQTTYYGIVPALCVSSLP